MNAHDIIPFLDVLHNYYARALAHVGADEWRLFAEYADCPLARDNAAIAAAVERIATAPQADIETFRYDFNALFVGPDELLAAPYETVYVSTERVLMRQATLSVREAYRRFGWEVDRKNTEADDNAAYELAFMSMLLASGDERSKRGFDEFVTTHFSQWVPAHVAAIRANTGNAVCLGFADLLEAVLTCCVSVMPNKEE